MRASKGGMREARGGRSSPERSSGRRPEFGGVRAQATARERQNGEGEAVQRLTANPSKSSASSGEVEREPNGVGDRRWPEVKTTAMAALQGLPRCVS